MEITNSFFTYNGMETAYSLHFVPFAVHGYGHCGFWPFICPDSGPKCAAQRTSRPHAYGIETDVRQD
jgi:hypothetical protein